MTLGSTLILQKAYVAGEARVGREGDLNNRVAERLG